MSYAPLIEGSGFLSAYPDQGRPEWVKQAQQSADDTIDLRLAEWDRTAWQHGNVPPDVKRAAEYLGAAEYCLLATMSSNPSAEVVPASVTNLRKQGEEILNEILSSGKVRLADGSTVGTKTDEQPSGGSSGRLFR